MTTQEEWSEIRESFGEATLAFVTLVSLIDDSVWDAPGLGTWSVRDLVGHTSRALLTVENYLEATTTTPPASGRTQDTLDSAAAYYLAATATIDPSQIDDRARAAGKNLGHDIAGSVSAVAVRVMDIVARHEADDPVATPVGLMSLGNYLPSRTFELTVHSMDLAQAIKEPFPSTLEGPISSSVMLAARIGSESGSATTILLALTGRRPLPTQFNVVI